MVERACQAAVWKWLRACRFGFAGGCVKKLKTMGESGVEQVRKAEMIAEIFRFGVKLREQICGAVVEWSSG